MIPVATIVSRLEAMLDAEGFDHYGFDEDFKPAINYAQEWLMQLYTRVLGQRKFSEEMLRELTYTRVWYTSLYSRVHFDSSDIGGEMWTILVVYPEPVKIGAWTPPSPYNQLVSYLTTFVYRKSNYSAKKTGLEKINLNIGNTFSQGNEVVTGDLKSYAYLPIVNYGLGNNISEIEIIPDYPTNYVAISYLLQPADITLLSDNVLFPKVLLPLIVNKAAQFISTKQGDKTSLYAVTDADTKALIQLTT